jgi:hypothetical protein
MSITLNTSNSNSNNNPKDISNNKYGLIICVVLGALCVLGAYFGLKSGFEDSSGFYKSLGGLFSILAGEFFIVGIFFNIYQIQKSRQNPANIMNTLSKPSIHSELPEKLEEVEGQSPCVEGSPCCQHLPSCIDLNLKSKVSHGS